MARDGEIIQKQHFLSSHNVSAGVVWRQCQLSTIFHSAPVKLDGA